MAVRLQTFIETDLEHGLLYVYAQPARMDEAGVVATTEKRSCEVRIDRDAEGKIFGIELIGV